VPWVATWETTPFTEIAAAGCILVVAVVAGAGGTTVVPGTAGMVVVGAELPDVSAPCLFAELGAVAVADPPCTVDTCGEKGFLVAKTLNDTSWPSVEGGGMSVSTSCPLDSEDLGAEGLAPLVMFGRLPAVELPAVEPLLARTGAGGAFVAFITVGIS
jgi:hypothetical protein